MTEQATGLPPRIARHSIEVERVKKGVSNLGEDMPEAIEAARKNLVHCNSLKMEALDHAAQLLALSPETADAYRSLRLGAEAVVAIFAGAMATDDQVEVRLGEGPPLSVPSAVTPDLHDGGNWTAGFYMAAICREKELLDSLCRVPVELLRRSTTRGLEHAYLFVQALQSYWRGERDSAGPRREAANDWKGRRMTAEEALSLARAAAAGEGWPWQDPVRVRRQRAWLFFGPAGWEIWTNAESLGSNVRIIIDIDDATGEVKGKHFLPR